MHYLLSIGVPVEPGLLVHAIDSHGNRDAYEVVQVKAVAYFPTD